MPTSYLPTQDKIPFGWPEGTGITIKSTDRSITDLKQIAEMLSMSGCHPKTAIRAAHCILEDGYYSTRVRTSTAMCRALWEDLDNKGFLLEFETEIPEGNFDHIQHERNRSIIVRSKQPPSSLVRSMINDLLEKEMVNSNTGLNI